MSSQTIPFEQWRPVPGARGYEISSRGRVRSFWVNTGAGFVVGDTPHPIQLRPNQRTVQLRKKHYTLDVLMTQVWGRPLPDRSTRPPTWHRLMLTPAQHTALLDILNASSHPRAAGLRVRARQARIVMWNDAIVADEMTDSCEG